MIDTNSATWATVAEYLRTSIDEARQRNDADLGVEDTAHLRGRIAAFKDLQALPQRLACDEQAEREAAMRPAAPTYMNPQDY